MEVAAAVQVELAEPTHSLQTSIQALVLSPTRSALVALAATAQPVVIPLLMVAALLLLKVQVALLVAPLHPVLPQAQLNQEAMEALVM